MDVQMIDADDYIPDIDAVVQAVDEKEKFRVPVPFQNGEISLEEYGRWLGMDQSQQHSGNNFYGNGFRKHETGSPPFFELTRRSSLGEFSSNKYAGNYGRRFDAIDLDAIGTIAYNQENGYSTVAAPENDRWYQNSAPFSSSQNVQLDDSSDHGFGMTLMASAPASSRDRSSSACAAFVSPSLTNCMYPGKVDQVSEMDRVVQLARQLNISGVLRDETHPSTQMLNGSPKKPINGRINSGPPLSPARPRGFSMPEISNGSSNCMSCRDGRDNRHGNPFANERSEYENHAAHRHDHLPRNPYAEHQQNGPRHSGFMGSRDSRGRMSGRRGGNLSHLRHNGPLLRPVPQGDFFENCSGRQASLPARHQDLAVVRSFGDHGPLVGQFNMPQGLCLGLNDEIIVADTLSHRIQIFDKQGKFMFLWGCPGVKKGQLWHPRKVAFIPETEHIVVSDRVNGCSRIQIFERTGQYVNTLGNLHSLRMALNTTTAGLTVYNNQIIVVEVQPPACVVLNEDGNVAYWFTLEGVMIEPSDVVVINQKYFISDFRGHCVCVFDSWGRLLFRLGGTSQEGIIRFPRGLGISPAGHLLVADTDLNRFHVSVWHPETGDLVSYHGLLDMKVSHSCGIVMGQNGNIVTAVKKDHMVLMLKIQEAVPASHRISHRNSHPGLNVDAPEYHFRSNEQTQEDNEENQ